MSTYSYAVFNNCFFPIHIYKPYTHTHILCREMCNEGCGNKMNPNRKSSLVMNRTVALQDRHNLYGAIRMNVLSFFSLHSLSKILFTFGSTKMDNGNIHQKYDGCGRQSKKKSCAKLFQLEIEIAIVVIMNGSVNLSIAKF